MARRTARQIYDDLTGAGFTPAAAVTMTAIALAESGGDDTARGDIALQNATWGPAFGLYQIRTLKADTGRGTDRDINALTSDDAQARAAYSISGRGTDFSPWSAFTSGAYRRYLDTVQAAVGVHASTTGGPAADAVPAGFGLDPRDWPSEALTQVRPVLIEGAFVLLGLTLVGLGLVRTFQPALQEKLDRTREGAEKAAKLVML